MTATSLFRVSWFCVYDDLPRRCLLACVYDHVYTLMSIGLIDQEVVFLGSCMGGPMVTHGN
jgi:hypothetical protein